MLAECPGSRSVPRQRRKPNQDYADEFQQELILLIAESLEIGVSPADRKSGELYRLPLRRAAFAAGHDMVLPARVAAAMLISAESLRVRTRFARWPGWVAWLWRGRLREHERLRRHAALVLAEYGDTDTVPRFMARMSTVLYGTARAPTAMDRAIPSPSKAAPPADPPERGS
jgi:hypothetical protein